MKVVLDTSAIFGNWFLDGSNFRVLELLARNGVCEIVIPEVVVLEIKNLYREELIDKLSLLPKLQALLPPKQKISHIDVEALCKAYDDFLTNKIRQLGVRIYPNNTIPQDTILRRLFAKRKPFNPAKTSDHGYRDALIWEIVLEKVLAKEVQTILISGNLTDFGDKDGTKLHPHLVEDLKSKGFPDTAIRICPSLGHWVSDYGKLHLERASIAEDLRDGEIKGFSLRTWFITNRQAFQEKLGDKIVDILSPWHELEEPTISYIEDPDKVEVDEARVIDAESIFIEAEVLTGVSIDVLIDKWSYDSGEFPIMLLDTDWNDSYVFAGLYTDLPIRFSATFDISKKTIVDFELQDIEIYGWCRRCGAVVLSDAAESCYKCKKDF